MIRKLLVIHLIVTSTISGSREDDEWKEGFKSDLIVPDVIEFLPKSLLTVIYNDTEPNSYFDRPEKIIPGTTLMRDEIYNPPFLDWKTTPGSLYTIFIINPDVPSRMEPFEAEWQYMTVYNIPGTDVSKGDHVVEYSADYDHEMKYGLQRIVLLVYKQNNKVDVSSMQKLKSNVQRKKDGSSRGDIHVKTFSKAQKFDRLIAGNYFYVDEGEKLKKVIEEAEENDPENIRNIIRSYGGMGHECERLSDCKQRLTCLKGTCDIFSYNLPKRRKIASDESINDECYSDSDCDESNRVCKNNVCLPSLPIKSIKHHFNEGTGFST